MQQPRNSASGGAFVQCEAPAYEDFAIGLNRDGSDLAIGTGSRSESDIQLSGSREPCDAVASNTVHRCKRSSYDRQSCGR